MTRRAAVTAIASAVLAGAASLAAVTGSQAERVAPCLPGQSPTTVVLPLMPRAFVSQVHQQAGADCIAWQELIYLSWPADPGRPGVPANVGPAALGRPGDRSPTVWESYPDAAAVFDPGSSPPADGLLRLHSVDQADRGWVTTRSGSPTYYEVKLNPDAADYVRENALTTAAGQLACTAAAGGLSLPHGRGEAYGTEPAGPDTDCLGRPRVYGLDMGAIEVKAAWVVLPSDGSLDGRYLTANALVTDPANGRVRRAVVGLTGLHVVHKVPGAAQMLWATFEHVDNAPDAGGAPPTLPANAPPPPAGARWTYYDPACPAAADPARCAPNVRPVRPCRARAARGCRPYSLPVQVTRLSPVDATVDAATADAWARIDAARPGEPLSVLRYYRLIDVQWPSQDVPAVPAGAAVPLPDGVITPDDSTRYVANTTMETFVQTGQSCMDCHRDATIAGSRRTASDYAFVFSAETRR